MVSAQSLIGAGFQLTRLASTAEIIADDSQHWAIESYIPIQTTELIEALLSRSDCPAGDGDRLRDVFNAMLDLLHHQSRPLHTGFAQRYAEIDPDRDTKPLLSPRSDDTAIADASRIAEMSREVLVGAGYSEVDLAELEKAVQSSSEWGVPLHVDFELFDLLAVYARGDVMGTRTARRWRKWFREVDVEVPLYQRVVVMFKLRAGTTTDDRLEHSMLHLRMFKNIPKMDIDMLLPGTRIRVSWFDHTKSIVPSIGGIGVTIYKLIRLALFVAVITYSIAAMIIGLTLAIVGYIIRSVLNYVQTRNRYMLNLTRSLYYQKLDSNAGVAFRLLHEAEVQRHREAVLAYFAILSSDGPTSLRRLRRRGQRIIRETVSAEVDFRINDAVKTLERWGLIARTADGSITTFSPEEAMKRMDDYWDSKIDA